MEVRMTPETRRVAEWTTETIAMGRHDDAAEIPGTTIFGPEQAMRGCALNAAQPAPSKMGRTRSGARPTLGY